MPVVPVYAQSSQVNFKRCSFDVTGALFASITPVALPLCAIRKCSSGEQPDGSSTPSTSVNRSEAARAMPGHAKKQVRSLNTYLLQVITASEAEDMM